MPRYCQAPFFSRPWTRPDGVSRITPETLAGHLTPGSVSCALSLTGPTMRATVAAGGERTMVLTRARPVAVVVLVAAALGLPGTVGAAPAPSEPGQPESRRPDLTVVSTDAERVTGGDVLVEVTVPRSGAPRGLRLFRNGVEVTDVLTEVEP